MHLSSLRYVYCLVFSSGVLRMSLSSYCGSSGCVLSGRVGGRQY